MSPLHFLWKRRNPLALLTELALDPADAIPLQVGSNSVILLKHPDLVQQLLVTEAPHIDKGRTAERELFFAFLGEGLLNVRGEAHRRQRRLMLPGFHRTRLSGYAAVMTAEAAAITTAWRNGEIRDLNSDMMALALATAGRTLFSADVSNASAAITNGFDDLTRNVNRMIFPGARWLLRTPLPFARRLRNSRRELDDTVHDLIKKRRAQAHDTGDLLSMLLMAEDAEQPGECLSDLEVRDQIMTLLFTGQGPIGNTLSWIWWLLAQHPEQEATLHAELDRVLGGRAPTFEDFPNLIVTEKIVRETLRLYPSIWSMGRRTLSEIEFAGCRVPCDSLVVVSQWITQRDERWFPDPSAFRPQRWTPEFRAALPRYAYFPFGGGPRSCIGENFAWMELVIIVASIASQWAFTPARDVLSARPHARITIHPDRPIWLQLHRRC